MQKRIFQKINHSKRRLYNLTAPGKAIKAFTDSPEAQAIIQKHRCGWLDGGCWSLAYAFFTWIGKEASICHVYNTLTLRSEHAACHLPVPNIYIDGDGLATKSQMIRKMISLENYDNGRLDIRLTTPLNNDPHKYWLTTANEIYSLLHKTFGPWHTSNIMKQIMKLPRTSARNDISKLHIETIRHSHIYSNRANQKHTGYANARRSSHLNFQGTI